MGEGEEWFDIGIDGCSDIYEFGEDSCLAVENIQWTTGLDLNGDNYIHDTVGDDWNLTNLNGTENNGSWDFSEPYKDWGTDGLPVSLAGEIDDNGTDQEALENIVMEIIFIYNHQKERVFDRLRKSFES